VSPRICLIPIAQPVSGKPPDLLEKAPACPPPAVPFDGCSPLAPLAEFPAPKTLQNQVNALILLPMR